MKPGKHRLKLSFITFAAAILLLQACSFSETLTKAPSSSPESSGALETTSAEVSAPLFADASFLSALGEGMSERMAVFDPDYAGTLDAGSAEYLEYRLNLVNALLPHISDYESEDFEDENLKSKANKLITSLRGQKELLEAFHPGDEPSTEFIQAYNTLGENMCAAYLDIIEQYDVQVDLPDASCEEWYEYFLASGKEHRARSRIKEAAAHAEFVQWDDSDFYYCLLKNETGYNVSDFLFDTFLTDEAGVSLGDSYGWYNSCVGWNDGETIRIVVNKSDREEFTGALVIPTVIILLDPSSDENAAKIQEMLDNSELRQTNRGLYSSWDADIKNTSGMNFATLYINITGFNEDGIIVDSSVTDLKDFKAGENMTVSSILGVECTSVKVRLNDYEISEGE